MSIDKETKPPTTISLAQVEREKTALEEEQDTLRELRDEATGCLENFDQTLSHGFRRFSHQRPKNIGDGEKQAIELEADAGALIVAKAITESAGAICAILPYCVRLWWHLKRVDRNFW